MTPDRSAWDIRRDGHVITAGRYMLAPRKIKLVRGKLFDSHDDRRAMLALLLENLGVDEAVRLGDPQVWRDAVAALPDAGRAE